MSIKLANPIYYPIAVLAGGIVLVIGTRFFKASNFVVLPAAAVVTTGIATLIRSQKVILRDLRSIKYQAKILAQQAQLLKQDADKILIHNSSQLELLGVVQLSCDRAIELPKNIDRLIQNISESESLLLVEELQQQLTKVRAKIDSSSGVYRDNLRRLESSLKNNIQLAQMGQDTRQSQVINLQTLIQDSAGVLQELQNKLASADLSQSSELESLIELGNELNSYQENVDIIVH
jgi:hypothetical protein